MKIDMNNAGTRWTLLEPLYYPLVGVTVPAGYVTDFASIPKWLGSIYPKTGNYAHAATLHDFLYGVTDARRSVADRLFREQMKLDGVGFRTRWTFWLMVRAFGWVYRKSPGC